MGYYTPDGRYVHRSKDPSLEIKDQEVGTTPVKCDITLNILGIQNAIRKAYNTESDVTFSECDGEIFATFTLEGDRYEKIEVVK